MEISDVCPAASSSSFLLESLQMQEGTCELNTAANCQSQVSYIVQTFSFTFVPLPSNNCETNVSISNVQKERGEVVGTDEA